MAFGGKGGIACLDLCCSHYFGRGGRILFHDPFFDFRACGIGTAGKGAGGKKEKKEMSGLAHEKGSLILQNKNAAIGDVLFLAAGELLASVIIMAVYAILGSFDFRVITGALIGSALMVLNFAILTFSVNRAVDRVLQARGSKDMSDEEAEAFAAQHSAEIQNSVKSSYLLRQVLILGVLIGAVLLNIANVVAAVIPLVLFRPILMAREVFRKKKA